MSEPSATKPLMSASLRRGLVALLGLAAVLLMAELLLLDPVLGRADNGDQARVLNDVGLRAQDATAFVHVRTHFDCAAVRSVPASTSSVLGLLLSRPACLIADELPIQLFGGVYLAIHSLGLLLFLAGLARSHRLPAFLLSSALLLMQTTNPYTLSFLNSFYEEAAMLSFATLALGLAAWRASAAPRALVETASAIALLGLAFTKVAHIIFLPLLIWTRGSRKLGLLLCLAAAVVVAGQVHKASHFQQPNAFNRVFVGLLERAPAADAESILQALGLSDLRRFSGQNYWLPEPRALPETDRQRVADAAGLLTVAKLYLSHPATAMASLQSLAVRTANASSELPYLAISNSGVWAQAALASPSSRVVRAYRLLATHAGAIAVGSWIVLLLTALCLRNRYLFALAMILGAYPFIVLLGDGTYEFEKHLLPFCTLTPLAMLLALQALALQRRAPPK